MMKNFPKLFIVTLFLISVNFLTAQVLSLDHGKVEFYTSSILSDIEATSEEPNVSLDLETGEVEITIAIKSFEFEYEMMQDHFNEEYMESDKFPIAIFVGKVDSDIRDLSIETEVGVSGQLTVHGVSKDIKFKATLSKQDGFTKVKCKFPIVFKDYNIEEPSVLTKSVAKDVEMKSILYLK